MTRCQTLLSNSTCAAAQWELEARRGDRRIAMLLKSYKQVRAPYPNDLSHNSSQTHNTLLIQLSSRAPLFPSEP